MNSNYSSNLGETRDIRFSGRTYKSKRTNSNSVSISRYRFHYIISSLLIDQFSRPVNIWLLIISVIQLSVSYSEREFLYITLLPFILMMILAITKDAIVTYRKYQYDVKANNALTKVWDGVVFTEINTVNLTVGDFVVLYNKERVPADMILLCTGSSENKCYVDTSALLDDKDLMAKVPIESIRFQLGFENLSEVAFKLKHIKGTATVPLPNSDYSNFEAKIRLKVAPVASNVKMKNFLLRDSKIMNTNWVIGLVVYTGNDTKAWINSLIIPRKVSSIEKTLNKITIILIGVVIISSAFSLILSVYVSENESFDGRGFIFLHFLVLYGILVPAPVYILIDLIKLFKIFRIQKKTSVNFRNGNIFEDLGKIEYILADKTGTLTEREINVSMCLFKNKFFGDIEDLIEVDGSPALDMETNSEKEEALGKNGITDKELFVMCLAVCNKGFTTDYGESYLTKSGDERVMISTAMILGIKLVKRTNKTLVVLKDGQETKFYVLGAQSMSKTRKKGHIVLQTLDRSKAFLYIIGSFEAMDEVINFVEKSESQILDIVRHNKQSGIRQLILAYKELSESEASLFSVAFQKANRSPINRQGRIESLFDEIEVNAVYLGLVGLEEAVDIETKIAVTALKHAGIKFWMLSGDSFESSLSAGFGSGIVHDSIPIVSIYDIKSEEEFLQVSENLLEKFIASEVELQKNVFRRSSLTIYQEPLAHIGTERSLIQSNFETPAKGMSLANRFSMNSINRNIVTDDFGHRHSSRISNNELLSRGKNIHPLVRKLTNKKTSIVPITQLKVNTQSTKFTLFIDSKSLDYAWKNTENLKNLVYLLFCANSVCFTSLLPSDKTKIAKILKNNFKSQPFFLAIGDGGSDVGMIKSAGIGIGILNNEGNQAASASDIVVNDFSDLKGLILREGLVNRANIKKSVILGVYSLWVLFILLFLINLICDFSGTVFIPVSWYVSYYLLFSVLGISSIGLYDNYFTLSFIESEPLVYMYEALNNRFIVRVIIISVAGALQAGVSVFVFYFGFRNYDDNIAGEGLLMFVSVFVTINVFHFMFINKIRFSSAIGPVLNLITCIFMVIIQSYTDLASDNYFVMKNFSGVLVIHVILCILFQFIISIVFQYIINTYILSPFEHPVSDGEPIPGILQKSSTLLDLSSIFTSKKDFEKGQTINSEYSKLTLKFKIPGREQKYQEYMISKRKKHYNTYLIIFTLILIILACVRGTYDPSQISLISILSILAFSLSISILLIYILHKPSQFLSLFKLIYLFSNFLIGLLAILNKCPPSLILLYPSTFFLFLSEDWLIMLATCSILSVLLFRSATLFMMSSIPDHDLYMSVIQFIAIYTISAVACGITTYFLKEQSLQQFNMLQKVKEDYDKVTSVLYYLLPGFVRKRVKNGARYIAEDQGEVSVLFCYIVGFDKITNEYSIEELTALLDEIFGKIDSLCELVGVSKIETVANTYMACAGLLDSESELKPSLRAIPHARRAIELGFAILRAAGQIYLKSGEKITLKIGVHSGKVTAGVVGYHKPQFSLVGDTVNTASRMASSAEKNTIRVSKYTYDIVGEAKNFDYTLNVIDVKGKGPMETYTITLHQMKNLDNFIEHRISLSHASLASAGVLSFVDAESSVSFHETEDVLADLRILATTQLFELENGEGLIEKIKWLWYCNNKSRENEEFRKDFLSKYFLIFFIGGITRILCDVIMLITHFIEFPKSNLYISVGLIVEILIQSTILFLLNRNQSKILAYYALAAVYILGLVLSITAYLKFSYSGISAMYILIHFQLIICCSGLFFSQIFVPAVLVSLYWFIMLIYQAPTNEVSVLLPSSFYFIAIQVFTLYSWEKYIRTQHNISYMTNKELDKTESLLTQMIPKHVYDHLKDENTVTDYFFQVTIIYADIVGFTPWSSGKEAREIVNMLSNLFTKFDKSSLKNKIYKVHTIGDCYVAMGYHGGVNRNPGQECVNMINFAYSMIKIIKKVQRVHKELNMRIGLHTGDVIGGIMGTSIVRYDIYGTDVLIANQMESNGIPGKIVISETTKSFLEKAQPKCYTYKFHTKVKTLERTCEAYELIKLGEGE